MLRAASILVLASVTAAAAQVPLGEELRLATKTTPEHLAGECPVWTPGGSFLTVWGVTHDTDQFGTAFAGHVEARRFDAASGSLGDPFQVATPGDWPRAVADQQGNILIAWADDFSDGRIFAQLVSPQGGARGPAFPVSGSHSAQFPNVARLPNGYVIVWDVTPPGVVFGSQVWGRVFDSNGQPRGDEFQIDRGDAQFNTLAGIASDDA